MTIWQLDEPRDSRYAYVSHIGSWEKTGVEPSICPECTADVGHRWIPPLLIEWEPGSDLIGDFVWDPASPEPLVKKLVYRKLRHQFKGIKPGPLEMRQDPKLKRPQRITKRTKPRVWLPYQGPPLCHLCAARKVHADMERSSISIRKSCSTCGRVDYEVTGIAHVDSSINLKTGDYRQFLIPRERNRGIYVHGEDLRGADFFEVVEFPDRVLCTDRAKRFIEEQRFTNVAFLEVGEVI